MSQLINYLMKIYPNQFIQKQLNKVFILKQKGRKNGRNKTI
jgi:hypothetical protein